VSDDKDIPPRKICEIYLRRTNCLSANLAFNPPKSRLDDAIKGICCLALAALCAIGIVWSLQDPHPDKMPYLLHWLVFGGLIFTLIGVAAVWPRQNAVRRALAIWERERQLPQPIEIFEGYRGLLIRTDREPQLYSWSWYLRVMILRRGRLWAAESIFDITYISRDDFPSQQAFDEFVGWANSQWQNRSTEGHAFEVLPAKLDGDQ
jgi:hypothetical protein